MFVAYASMASLVVAGSGASNTHATGRGDVSRFDGYLCVNAVKRNRTRARLGERRSLLEPIFSSPRTGIDVDGSTLVPEPFLAFFSL